MSILTRVKLFWLIFFLLPVNLIAQFLPRDITSGKFYYSEEVLVKDGPQQDLYHRAKSWFASLGQNKKTLRQDDSVNGMVIGDIRSIISVFDGHQNQKFKLGYTVHVQLTDDRYWLSLTDFQLQNLSLLKESGSAKETPINNQPLEAWLKPQSQVNLKDKEPIYMKGLENAVYKSIFTQLKDLKAHML
ncbi:hypothetical protein AHMF7605_09650 [Adhaeribacter arboris]|uniref:DUF4468 domain-containing protein n=1 Tax=Adhaeribacter arboris TaxID=2072846 RepID=A0A2T2YE86_9BACT|nr:DUF4468 domain-containing protein [Adhaeribacter arboris]PSR53768.1 hypothetical protein AHMF7605_09650 [Adhaeribacter arboris]